jgi:excisionase family DNA binding protein
MQGDRTLLAVASTPPASPGVQQERLTWTVAEVAHLLGISVATAYARVKSGAIPHLRLEGRILVPRKALLELLDTAASPASTSEAGESA